jgi:hypothetical protein
MPETWLQRERYLALRDEMRGATRELARLELGCVVALAFLFAWLARDSGNYTGYQGLVWGVPILLPAYGLIKARSVQARWARLREELEGLEATMPPEPGAPSAPPRTRTRAGLSLSAWVLLLVLTVAGSVIGYMDYRNQCPGPLHNACLQDDSADAPDDGT